MVFKVDSGVFLLFFLFVFIVIELLWLELWCNFGQFVCCSGIIQCIFFFWQCDGWVICEDESDEVNCLEVMGEVCFYYGKEVVDL